MDLNLKLKRNTERSDRVLFAVASATTSILALCAAILSFSALRELALQAGYGEFLSYLFPITLDGLIVSGSALTLFAADRGERSYGGIALTALGVIGSIVGNVAVSEQTLLAQAVHAVPPTVLFLSLEGLTSLMRRRIKESIARDKMELEAELAKQSSPKDKTQNITPSQTQPNDRNEATNRVPKIHTPQQNLERKPNNSLNTVDATPQQLGDDNKKDKPSIPSQARQLLLENPDADIADLANRIDGNDKKYIRRVLRQQRDKLSS